MWSQYKELCRHKLKVEASHGYCLLDLKMTVENYAWLYNLTVSVLKRQKQEDQSSRSCSDTFWSLKPAWATKVHVWDVWGKAWQSCKMVKSISLSWNFDFLPFCVPMSVTWGGLFTTLWFPCHSDEIGPASEGDDPNGQRAAGDCLTTQDPMEMHFCCPVDQLVVDLRGLIQHRSKLVPEG